MCPLFNERITAGEGPARTSSNTSRDHAEFLKHWRYDPKLGREREFSDAELAVMARVPREDFPHPPSDFEMQQLNRKEIAEQNAARNERERQAKLVANVAAKQKAAQQKLAAEEFALDSFYSTHGATEIEQKRVNNKCVLDGTYGNVEAHWAALAELRSRGK